MQINKYAVLCAAMLFLACPVEAQEVEDAADTYVKITNDLYRTVVSEKTATAMDFGIKEFVPYTRISWDCETGAEQFFIQLARNGVSREISKPTLEKDEVVLAGIGTTDVWKVDENGNFKWDIVFHDKPKSMVQEWTLTHTPGIVFNYQDTLEHDYDTQVVDKSSLSLAQFLATNSRPENVVGSYAVYSNRRGHKVGGPNYQTGKLAHIYRPFCIDAGGKKEWAELCVGSGILRITLPAAWMESAKYPVRLDPTLGYTSAGASNTSNNANYIIFLGPYTATEDGTVTAVWHHLDANGYNHTFGYFDDGYSGGLPNTLIADDGGGTLPDGDQWHERAVSGSITNGETYWIAFNHGTDTHEMHYDSGTKNARYESSTYVAGTLASPVDSTASWYTSRDYSAYLVYTASGGPAAAAPQIIRVNIF